MRNEFVHLHLHSHYSLLDAMNRFDHLAEAVKSRGMRAVALTDHGNLFGAIEFYKTIYAHGVKPIIGCEVYVAPGSRHDKEKRPDRFERGFHLTLLASSADGYRNLVKLSSLGFTEGFYYNARVDYETLDTYSEGLIALSGCLSSEAAKKYLSGNETGAREAIDRNREIFGKENFFIELMDHGIAEQKQYMQFLLETAHRDEIPTIATNDVHYLDQKDCHFHDALLCVGTRSHISDTKRKKYGAQEFFLKTPDEMAKVFGFDLGTLKRTVEIAERVELDIEFGKNHLPSFPIPIGEGNEIEYLEKLALEGLISKVDNPNDDYRDRLKYELKIIGKKGFPGYFLIVADFISEAKRRGIPVGPGRGSAAGSLVSFTLGITDVDPMKYGLIFERFLNPERTELPDIDVDICQTRREEVIDYVKERYGHDRVAQIITFGTFGPRAVLRDVARVQEISIQETEKLIKLIPDQLKITLPEAIDKVDELKKASEGPYKDLFDTALGLEGLARHASRHAAGVVIANLPITEVAPLYRDSEGHIITQFDMNSVVALGLLKMDILGLKTLSVVARAEKLAGRMSASGDSPYEFCADIGDMDDPKVFDLLSSGRTLGVFQLDSSGIRDLIMKVKPSCFEDLAAMIALYRPGPISLADDFAARKHGKQDVVYLHPSIEKILNTTYGIILYQEQVMEIAHVVGNFKLSEADSLRKAMGKKNPELMGSYREKFVKGAVQNEVKTEISKKLFDQMEQFAGYGFNKSHAIAYAVIAYKTAWLKVHEPIAYMAAVLSFESGNTDKLAIYIEEARRMGIEVMPPDVNTSHVYFEGSPEKKNAIMYGLPAVKGVGLSLKQVQCT
ncbi:MAG: DNA polymerase III subunit alpha, partial [Candidatus Lindowbacteria bacterium]|nr:DNA polymerase III subunit alpha [Candidatus Lindowbacteria bacterium]